MASILKAGLPTPAPASRPSLPPIRYAAAAAAAVNPSQAMPPTPSQDVSNPPPSAPTAPSITASSSAADVSLSPSLTHPSVASPMLSSASVSYQPDGSFYSGQESPSISEAGPAATSSPQRNASRKGTNSNPCLNEYGIDVFSLD